MKRFSKNKKNINQLMQNKFERIHEICLFLFFINAVCIISILYTLPIIYIFINLCVTHSVQYI